MGKININLEKEELKESVKLPESKWNHLMNNMLTKDLKTEQYDKINPVNFLELNYNRLRAAEGAD